MKTPRPAEIEQAVTKGKDLVETPTKGARKRYVIKPTDGGLGGMAYSDRELAPHFTQPIGKKGEPTRNTWADTAYVLVLRAKRAAQTYGKKDFNSLYRLILSAGIAFDKAFPQQVVQPSGNLVVQLFGSLGPEQARKIVEPAHPILDITPEINELADQTLAETSNEKPSEEDH